jgi:AAA+ ATPase superfamily predicted ATPase
MRFFDRTREIAKLKDIRKRAQNVAQFTVITGRRRIGKTSLLLKAYDDEPILYFFISRKAESELCRDFVNEIEEKMDVPILGDPNKFSIIFEYLMKLSETRTFTLIIDEFQEFLRVNKSVFSEMQRIWDLNKSDSHINLLVCGSVNSLMNKLFRDKHEPLYGRQTDTIKVGTFSPSVLKEIISVYNPDYTTEDLLSLYLYTGGVAKYIELLMDGGATTSGKILDKIIEQDSLFISEGKAMLIEEFGKDYGIYFSILTLIAQGHNTRGDIEGILKSEIGGYITKLEKDYGLIIKNQPLFEKSPNKNVHYEIGDNFLRFWFRFIYKYNYMIEIGSFQKLREIVSRDYESYSGRILESYFKKQMIESEKYTRIGSWKDRKGENEIDIIAADDLNKTVDFIEVKRQEKDLDMSILRSKAEQFFKATGEYKRYKVFYKGLSMKDM